MRNNKISSDTTRINHEIDSPKVRLIGESGEQIGIVSLDVAISVAEEANLDLVEIAPNANPPVCKILEFGKYRYEKQKKLKQNRKKQHTIQVKEIRLRPSIDDHDLLTKIKKAEKFVEEGSKLRFTVLFRGREMARMEVGRVLLDRVAEILSEVAKVEKAPETEGRRMTLIMAPK